MMTVRLAVLLVASLAVAAVADAECLKCGSSLTESGWAFCEPSSDGYCQYPCCFRDPGEACWTGGDLYQCAGGGELLVPSVYFGTRLPLVTEGSALRLQLVKAEPVRQKCAPGMPRRRT